MTVQIHCGVHVAAHDLHGSICGVFQCRLQGSHILLAELGQHPVRQIILGIWLRPHAYADTGKFLRAQLCDNALDAVVSAGTALSPQPQLSRRQGDVIINDQHLLRRDLVEVRRRRNGIAAEVHVCRRLHQQAAYFPQHRLAAVGLKLHLVQFYAAALFRQFLHRQKAGIVAGVFVFQPGVSQTGNTTISGDFEQSCRDFQQEIANRGGIDLLILGLGENGHLGFNQPESPFGGEAWVTRMNVELEERIRRETGTPPDKELGGATLGIKNIMQARRIVLVAKGTNKANIVKWMLEGPVTTDVPASILQLHPNCEFLLDEAAASMLNC